jgi:hypothetical protein
VTSLDDTDGLIPQLVKHLVRELTHPRNIYSELSGDNRAKQFYFALEVLSYFRENTRLPPAQIRRLSPGSYLRSSDKETVLTKMAELGLLGAVNSIRGARLTKNLFPELLKVG